jgi:hypothetical protein
VPEAVARRPARAASNLPGATRPARLLVRPRAPWVARFLATAAILGLAQGDAAAHLRRIGESLVAALEQSDALVIAEAVAATEDRRDPSGRLASSVTRFRLREVLAGEAPAERFAVASPPPALRYARGQVAILAIASERAAGEVPWRSALGPGSALISTGLDGRTRAGLVALWDALPAAEVPGGSSAAVAEALERLLDAAPRKLALMAALDLADLGHAGRLPPSVAAALVSRLQSPGLPAELRPVLQHALSEPPSEGGPIATPEAEPATAPPSVSAR